MGCVVVVVETFFDRERCASLSLSLFFSSSDGNVVADVFAVVVVVMVVGLLFPNYFSIKIPNRNQAPVTRQRPAKGQTGGRHPKGGGGETTAPSSESNKTNSNNNTNKRKRSSQHGQEQRRPYHCTSWTTGDDIRHRVASPLTSMDGGGVHGVFNGLKEEKEGVEKKKSEHVPNFEVIAAKTEVGERVREYVR